MLGLLINKPGELELKEIPSTTILQDNEVKIRLIYGGICGSDLSVFKGRLAHATYPICPGHELIGTIFEVGRNSTFEIGQRVVVMPNSYCDECENCRNGRRNICINKKSLGVNIDGGFSEEFIISEKYVMRIPDELPNEKAVLIEPFAVIVHALEKVSITKDTTVAIIGCGTEGLLAITLANHLGATITGVDIKHEKLEKIKGIFPNIETALPEGVKGKVFDVVIETAGARSSFEQGVEIVKPGGAMVLVGITPEATIPVVQVVRKEITLYGSIIYNIPNDFQKSIDYLKKESFKVDQIVSKIYHFTDYAKAYEDATSGNYGKILLNFREV
ncbi:sorbitol dehydrogenase [Bacillus timonensis]|uniref:Sorbitol dehydrogenase n=1 Tax=Bacillus timonensis TaxID=1033734 RepID=A0A4S3PMU5_9BACI|nr:alcohol dehydrogenase catalytic domain-containing protein [Bacillus timonensis]THE10534.1 sorbitol dehydrogenase [Bacillus timonensis]